MAYNIPTVLGNGAAGNNIVIADGSLDSTTLLNLPGRNYSGYGQPVDTNLVQMLQNFANSSIPTSSKLVAGQFWFNTNGANATSPGSMYIYSGFPNVWLKIVASDPNNASSNSSFKGTLTVQGNLNTTDGNVSNSWTVGNTLTVNTTINTSNLTANGNVTLSGAVSNIVHLVSSDITPQPSTTGQLNGNWSMPSGNLSITNNQTIGGTLTVSNTITGGNLATGGNLSVTGNSTVAGNSSVTGNLSVSGNIGITTAVNTALFFNNGGNIFGANTALWTSASSLLTLPNANVTGTLTTTNITAGASGTAATMTGQWTLAAGSRLNATYADLAERFAADDVYAPGTVVELGGEKEITAVIDDLSDRVFGVVSETAGYLMNAEAGDNDTHPPIAMSGRVDVKVRGTVVKGDRLVAAGKGIARAAKVGEYTPYNTIGRALEDKHTDGIGHVLAAVGARVN
jgi:cytoskeletal protein CcmA (bactofilin family)